MAAKIYAILFFSSPSIVFAVVQNLQMVPALMGPTMLMLGGGVPYHPHHPVAFPTGAMAAPAPTGTVPMVPPPYLLLPVSVPTMPTHQFQNTTLVFTTAAAAAAAAPLGVPPVQVVAIAAEMETVAPTTPTTEPEMGTDTVERKPDDDTSNT